MKKKAPGSQAEKEKKGNGSTGANVLLVVAAAANMACPGVQVRKEPVPQPCPAGAVETMTRQLGLPVGHRGGSAAFSGWEKRMPVPVKEGPFSIELHGDWEVDGRTALPNGTRLSGQLCYGEKRVYGRVTQAVTPTGDTFTVCMELYEGRGRGIEIEPNGGVISVHPFVEVETVERFQ
jgi:eukaryotic-like serine/threonine-protein kinase